MVRNDTWYIMGGSNRGVRFANATVYRQGNFYDGFIVPYGSQYACAARVNETHFFFSGGDNHRPDAYLVEIDSWTWHRLGDMYHSR